MEDTASCGSRTPVSGQVETPKQRQKRFERFNEVLQRLRELKKVSEATISDFEDELWAHFERLPLRYAIDLDVDRAEDVLMHKSLLKEAENSATASPVIEVRLVEFLSDGIQGQSAHINFTGKVDPHSSGYSMKESIHPGPTFAKKSPYLKLVHEASRYVQDKDIKINCSLPRCRLMQEITISTVDQQKLFTRLTCLLSEVGLNIDEAHAFSTTDGYCLDVFYVDCQPYGEAEQIKKVLLEEMSKIEKYPWLKDHAKHPVGGLQYTKKKSLSNHSWEIDANLLKFERKLTLGSYGDLYKGTFCGQDVAIKVLRTEYLNENMQREFNQEVDILRKIQHNNIVKFIGACTKPSNLCIVTEFMAGGSMYDLLHKQKCGLELPFLLGVAIHVSNGMSYLHQKNIIHRDLKAANLLLDEKGVVKVADFGVARVQTQGVMTAETGTYRWMAPEVIEHRPYDHKADVFSFGILLWELLTGKLPYENLTPLQAAIGVVQKELRPVIPSDTHPKLVELLERCWQRDPSLRPEFSEIRLLLLDLAKGS
ncbi:hypothetical protein SLA2020_094990 [Shorea laevis]